MHILTQILLCMAGVLLLFIGFVTAIAGALMRRERRLLLAHRPWWWRP
jgi:UPF0716 family protein affecting phage T7 exclusion